MVTQLSANRYALASDEEIKRRLQDAQAVVNKSGIDSIMYRALDNAGNLRWRICPEWRFDDDMAETDEVFHVLTTS